MAEQWIAAAQALSIAQSPFALCERLHAGLVIARARSLRIGERSGTNVVVPKEFWWAEGHEALTANWSVGDFSTWIEQKTECRAFGVQMALAGVIQMIPFEERANTIRSLSVVSKPDWITAKEARHIAYSELGHNPLGSGEYILEIARLGLVTARAVLAQRTSDPRIGPEWEEREWDIPDWFWEDCTRSGSSAQNWETGKFSGRGRARTDFGYVTLSGVHFLRSTISATPNQAEPADTPSPGQRGRKPSHDWEGAVAAIWGEIYRGSLVPNNQAQIEKALQARLTVGDREPSESTVRPYASRIWSEISKA